MKGSWWPHFCLVSDQTISIFVNLCQRQYYWCIDQGIVCSLHLSVWGCNLNQKLILCIDLWPLFFWLLYPTYILDKLSKSDNSRGKIINILTTEKDKDQPHLTQLLSLVGNEVHQHPSSLFSSQDNCRVLHHYRVCFLPKVNTKH